MKSNLREMMNKAVNAAVDASMGVESPVMASLNHPATRMMLALQTKADRQGFEVYAGTANRNKVAKRRARNKVAARTRAAARRG